VTRSAGLTTVAQVVSQLALAGVYLIAARAGAPASFGATVAAVGVAVIVVDLVDFGGNQLLTRELASHGAPRNLYVSFLVSKARILAAVVPLWIVVAYTLTGSASIAALGLYVGTLGIAQTGQAALRGVHAFGLLSSLMMLERITAFVVAVLVYSLSSRPSVVLATSLVTASALAACAATVAARARARVGSREASFSLRRWYARSRGLGLSAVFSDLQVLDVILVAVAAGTTAAGYFAAANRLLAVLILVPVNIGYVLLPTLSSLSTDRARRRLTRHAVWLCVALVAAVVVIPITLSGPLMELLFGSAYGAAGGALVVYCVAVLLVAVNQPLTVYLQTAGRDMPVGYLMAGLSLLNIPVVLLLSREFGQTGAAGGFLLVQVLLVCSLLALWRRPATSGPAHEPVPVPSIASSDGPSR
jgi:O-antigen/teichoic acid export membrane protein